MQVKICSRGKEGIRTEIVDFNNVVKIIKQLVVDRKRKMKQKYWISENLYRRKEFSYYFLNKISHIKE